MQHCTNIAKNIEAMTFYFINHKLKCRTLDAAMPRITHMGNAFFTIGLALAIILFGKSDAKIVGWQALAALVSSHCLVQSLKLLLRRMRPFVTLKDVNILGKLPKDPSFPSGHSTASFALATSLTLYWPAIAAISMSAAVLVALSRVYLGYHYPSDIMAGTLLGIISALGMGWII